MVRAFVCEANSTVMQFPGTLAELRSSLGLGEPVDFRPEGQVSRLVSPDYITVNDSNSRIATVTPFNDGRLKLLQQLWDAQTGKLLWKHEQLHLSGWAAYPSFTPDGQYAGFYDEDRVYLVHSYTLSNFATIRFSTHPGSVKGLPATRPILAFAIANGGRNVAIAYLSKSYGFDGRHGGERSQDVISVTESQQSPQLCYTPDGNHIFVIYRTWKTKGWLNTEEVSTLIVDCFDITAPDRKPRRAKIPHVASYRFRGGMTVKNGEGCVVLDVVLSASANKYTIISVSTTGNRLTNFDEAAETNELIVSHHKVLSITGKGAILEDERDWVSASSSYEHRIMASIERSLYIGSRVLAFDYEKGSKVTLLSRDGEFQLADLKAKDPLHKRTQRITTEREVLDLMHASKM